MHMNNVSGLFFHHIDLSYKSPFASIGDNYASCSFRRLVSVACDLPPMKVPLFKLIPAYHLKAYFTVAPFFEHKKSTWR